MDEADYQGESLRRRPLLDRDSMWKGHDGPPMNNSFYFTRCGLPIVIGSFIAAGLIVIFIITLLNGVALRGTQRDLTSVNDTLTDTIEDLSNVNDTLNDTIQDLSDVNTTLCDKVMMLDNELTMLLNMTNEDFMDFFANSTDKFMDLMAKDDAIDDKLMILMDNVTNLDAAIVDLNSQTSDLDDRLTDEEAKTMIMMGNITNLDGRVTVLEENTIQTINGISPDGANNFVLAGSTNSFDNRINVVPGPSTLTLSFDPWTGRDPRIRYFWSKAAIPPFFPASSINNIPGSIIPGDIFPVSFTGSFFDTSSYPTVGVSLFDPTFDAEGIACDAQPLADQCNTDFITNCDEVVSCNTDASRGTGFARLYGDGAFVVAVTIRAGLSTIPAFLPSPGNDVLGAVFMDIGTSGAFNTALGLVSRSECVADLFSNNIQPRGEPPMVITLSCTRLFYHTSAVEETWLYASFRYCGSYENDVAYDCFQIGFDDLIMKTEVTKVF